MYFSTDLVHAGRWPVRSLNSRGWGWQWCWAGSGQVEGMERWVFADPPRSFPHRCRANRCQSIHPKTWQSALHSLGTEFAAENREQLKFIYIYMHNNRLWSMFFSCILRTNSVSLTLEKGPANLQSPLNPKAVEVSKNNIESEYSLTTLWVPIHSFIDNRMIFIASHWTLAIIDQSPSSAHQTLTFTVQTLTSDSSIHRSSFYIHSSDSGIHSSDSHIHWSCIGLDVCIYIYIRDVSCFTLQVGCLVLRGRLFMINYTLHNSMDWVQKVWVLTQWQQSINLWIQEVVTEIKSKTQQWESHFIIQCHVYWRAGTFGLTQQERPLGRQHWPQLETHTGPSAQIHLMCFSPEWPEKSFKNTDQSKFRGWMDV